MAANRSPEDLSVLYLQATHMSSTVSSLTVDDIVKVKRSDNLIWKLFTENYIHNRVLVYLNHMGFYGVLLCGAQIYDNHLITALVERWRRETHTFHFTCGEATVTLQDVSIIWGLTIDGEPVTGVDVSHKVEEWQHICLDMLGFLPASKHLKGGHMSMTALYDHCMSNLVTDDSLEVDVVKFTRCIALMIIGGIMFPDYQGGSARLLFLQLLRDIDNVKSYSWGSAVLAFLYRELCNASRIEKTTMAGPLYILQIWAWSRIKCVNPDRDGLTLVVPPVDPDDIIPVFPYGARWNVGFSYTHSPTHAVRIIRDSLDRMNHNEFNWIVYKKNDIDVKTIIDSYENKIWRCVCPLICFDIVEMHRPNRVMRQFRRRQSIPVAAVDNDDMHTITRIGHRGTDWRDYHRHSIELWNNRMRYVAKGVRHGRSMQTDEDYFQWYNRITVRTISPEVTVVGFQPHPYNTFVGQHNVQQNFSTPSPFSHQSALGWGSDMVGQQSGFAGTSTINPSIELNVAGTSSTQPGILSNLGFRNFSSFGQPDFQTPYWSNTQSFTNMLNVGPHHLVHDTRPPMNVISPITFPGYSNEEIPEQVRLRRGTRRRNPPDCGTGSHLYHYNYDDDSST
ncbi:serine/threonine-protein phosphatase 7 long form homolog [Primulina eburnea]|uniref:serine/threonine-protein phosphatase 7 long form homolog n=1 Tax=Primulina eburnea TaxID=1245227 RepID=UPI003C6C7C35